VLSRGAPTRSAERQVWRAAGVAALVLGLVLAFQLLRPRDQLTGTNGAGSSGPVVHVAAGQELCVGGLDLPPGTGRVELRLAPLGPTNVAARIAGSSQVVALGAQGGPPGSTPTRLDVPVPRAVRGPQALCVTPSGPIDVAGRAERYARQAAPTVAGAPVGGVVAAWYRPPAGERRSVLASLPDIARRAARLRPGIVGPWTYWALLLAIGPLLGLAAVLLVARTARHGALRRRTPALVALVAFAAAASWSLLTPILNAPDELEHVSYAQAIAEQGRAPSAGPSPRRAYSTQAQAAYEGGALAGQYRQADGRPPWTAAAERDWARRDRGTRGDDGAGWTTVADYTPAYYTAAAGAYALADGGSFWTRVTAMRLLTALMVSAAALFTVLLVAELLPSRPELAVVAGLWVALQPMVSFMGGMVNNDGPVIALCAAAAWLVVRALRRGLTPRLAAALGVVLVAAPMVKGNGLFVLPPVALGLVGVAWRARPAIPWRALGAAVLAALVAVVAFVVLADALGHSADPTRPGWYAATGSAFPTLPGRAVAPSLATSEPVRFAQYLWELALPPLPGMEDVRPGGVRAPAFTAYVERAWGAFAFAVVLFPRWVYVLICLVLAGLGGLGLRALLERRGRLRAWGWELAVLLGTVATVVLGTEVAYYAPKDPTVPEFGRYLFPAAAAFAALAAGALLGAGRRAALTLGAGGVAAMAVLWWSGLWLTAAQLYT
jgi:4-amino-4-deoxy-L-arabinose transferase-like glycosyltransferase